MAARKTLRTVRPGEKARVKSPSTVAQAVECGTRRDELVTMRARIARAIDDPNIRGADLASLSRRLLEIGKELEALDAHEREDAEAEVERPSAARFDASAI